MPTGDLNDIIAVLTPIVFVLLPASLALAGAVGGLALSGFSGFKLWQCIREGDGYRGQGSTFGWLAGFVIGSLITMFTVFVGLASFLFTGWG